MADNTNYRKDLVKGGIVSRLGESTGNETQERLFARLFNETRVQDVLHQRARNCSPTRLAKYKPRASDVQIEESISNLYGHYERYAIEAFRSYADLRETDFVYLEEIFDGTAGSSQDAERSANAHRKKKSDANKRIAEALHRWEGIRTTPNQSPSLLNVSFKSTSNMHLGEGALHCAILRWFQIVLKDGQ
jgi:hypothetical protein